MSSFDVVVCGLGVTGCAALRDLSRRGLRVLGIDRFAPGHDRGSSHGATRVIRLDYFEHPSYVPLLRRAYELWHELEQSSDQKLIHITGIVEIGPPDGMLITGVLASIRQHSLRHELLSAEDLTRRYPAFHTPPRQSRVAAAAVPAVWRFPLSARVVRRCAPRCPATLPQRRCDTAGAPRRDARPPDQVSGLDQQRNGQWR